MAAAVRFSIFSIESLLTFFAGCSQSIYQTTSGSGVAVTGLPDAMADGDHLVAMGDKTGGN
jgi:hypothetical protein